MPELPEVETVMRGLRARLTGRRIRDIVQRRADIRFPLPAELGRRLAGRGIAGFDRRAKYIIIRLDDGQALLLHLGMSGRLLLDGLPRGAHEHLTFAFDDGTQLRFVDPRRFGMLDLCAADALPGHPWLRHLGLEPLAADFDGAALQRVLARTLSPLKVAVMDQRRIVGVGNIYASESLHRARLSPRRAASLLRPVEAARLAASIVMVLEEAIAAGGSSLRDYVQTSGELGSFQRNFRVYDRAGEPCPTCARPIERLVQGGRATFFCGRCQR